MTNNLLEQTKSFCEEAEWLGSAIHAAPKTQLIMLAEEIMQQPASGALHSQFGLLFRFLYGLKPAEEAVVEQDLITRILSGENAPSNKGTGIRAGSGVSDE